MLRHRSHCWSKWVRKNFLQHLTFSTKIEKSVILVHIHTKKYRLNESEIFPSFEKIRGFSSKWDTWNTTARHDIKCGWSAINPPYRKKHQCRPEPLEQSISTSLETSCNPASFHNPSEDISQMFVIIVEQRWLAKNCFYFGCIPSVVSGHVPSSIARLSILIRVSGQINAL